MAPLHEHDEPQAVRRQLDKILASEPFVRSARISRFLRFTVEQTLAGHGEELKEYLLGVEVFDRKESYDSRVDPIVRVEARRLRAKLRQYYETTGQADAVVIDFPTGSYVPSFRPRAEAPPAPPAPQAPNTIAVLPFANLSPEPDYEYFSDGLTAELIHGLTKVECLRVVAWQSAAQLRGRDLDIHAIRERLKAGTVLTGSVRRAGEQLRVTAQLIDTATGVYLWSETYDRALRDLFTIQEEISWAIIGTLKIRLAGAPAIAAAPPTTWRPTISTSRDASTGTTHHRRAPEVGGVLRGRARARPRAGGGPRRPGGHLDHHGRVRADRSWRGHHQGQSGRPARPRARSATGRDPPPRSA